MTKLKDKNSVDKNKQPFKKYICGIIFCIYASDFKKKLKKLLLN